MKYKNTNIYAAALAVLIFAGATVFAQDGGLGSRKWDLVELNGQRVARSKAFIEINSNETRVTGNAGCNRLTGSVAVIGKRIEFSKIATTKMFCSDRNVMKQESALVRALAAAKRYNQTGNSLELIDRNRTVAKFTATRESGGNASGLDDKKWVLESIADRKTFKALPYAFLNFDSKKGSVGGNTSCNVFGGEYTANGKRLAITDVISTMRACVEDDRMSVEREFLDGLRRADRYEIANSRLTLYSNKKVLLSFRGEAK